METKLVVVESSLYRVRTDCYISMVKVEADLETAKELTNKINQEVTMDSLANLVPDMVKPNLFGIKVISANRLLGKSILENMDIVAYSFSKYGR